MKFLFICLVSLYFTTKCFANDPTPKERQCAIDHGFPDLEFEDISYKMFCSHEEPRDLIDEGDIVLFKDITKGENTLDYVYTIGRSWFSIRGKHIPLKCNGELSDVWNACKKLNGYPKISYEDTITLIHGDDQPKANFKEFLFCGLKLENILTSEGTLDEEFLNKTLFGKKILKLFSEKPPPEDKAEFAYQIAKNYRY